LDPGEAGGYYIPLEWPRILYHSTQRSKDFCIFIARYSSVPALLSSGTLRIGFFRPNMEDLHSDVTSLQPNVTGLQANVRDLQRNVRGLQANVKGSPLNAQGLRANLDDLPANV
jgi:hypothetical protein